MAGAVPSITDILVYSLVTNKDIICLTCYLNNCSYSIYKIILEIMEKKNKTLNECFSSSSNVLF